MDRYTKIVLTVIAVALIGNLFDKNIITDANAVGYWQILNVVDINCYADGSDIICSKDNIEH
jgi:hypothetical protein